MTGDTKDQTTQATQSQDSTKPIETLRDGNLKASIWRNEGENGPTYSTTFARTWRDDKGRFHDSQSYAGTDMLRLGELSRSAYHRTNELRRDQAVEQTQDRGKETQDRGSFMQQRGGAAQDQSRKHSR